MLRILRPTMGGCKCLLTGLFYQLICCFFLLLLLWLLSFSEQAAGGRPPRYAPLRPPTDARSGSLQPGRPGQAGPGRAGPDQPIRAIQPAGRPHTPPADRMYATDVRQTDRCRTASLFNAPWRGGHNKSKQCSLDFDFLWTFTELVMLHQSQMRCFTLSHDEWCRCASYIRK